MAKKDENFDFDTEGKAKVSFDLSFLKNLTKQQKGIILAAVVGVVLVIAIVIVIIDLVIITPPRYRRIWAGRSNVHRQLPDMFLPSL